MKCRVLSQGTLFSASLHTLGLQSWRDFSPHPRVLGFSVLYVTVMSPSSHLLGLLGILRAIPFFPLSVFVHLPISPCNGMTDGASLNFCQESRCWGSGLSLCLIRALPISVELSEWQLGSDPWVSGRSFGVRKPCLSLVPSFPSSTPLGQPVPCFSVFLSVK